MIEFINPGYNADPTYNIYINGKGKLLTIKDDMGFRPSKDHLRLIRRDELSELLNNKNINTIINEHNNNTYNQRMKEQQIRDEREEKIRQENANRTRKPKTGIVYLLQDRLQRTKIGKTNDLDKRIFSISRLHPEKLTLFHHFISKDVTQSERDLHSKYKEYRLNGEWFNLPQEELVKIKEIYI